MVPKHRSPSLLAHGVQPFPIRIDIATAATVRCSLTAGYKLIGEPYGGCLLE
jgi:hypothetical protein